MLLILRPMLKRPSAFCPTSDLGLVTPGISALPRPQVIPPPWVPQTSLPLMSLWSLISYWIYITYSSIHPPLFLIIYSSLQKIKTHCFLFYNLLALVQFKASCKKLFSWSSNNIMIELSLIKIDYYHLWSLVMNLNLDVSKWDLFFQDLFLLWEVRLHNS